MDASLTHCQQVKLVGDELNLQELTSKILTNDYLLFAEFFIAWQV
jgi:hypothetical protein